jgi:hypothetical protein
LIWNIAKNSSKDWNNIGYGTLPHRPSWQFWAKMGQYQRQTRNLYVFMAILAFLKAILADSEQILRYFLQEILVSGVSG